MSIHVRPRVFLSLALAALVAAACGSDNAGPKAPDGSTAVVPANDFALADRELVLTLDDGPGPRTIELAEWLAANDVPAVFFMTGKNAKANPEAVARVVELSKAKNGLFLVANHSMTHTLPVDKQGVRGLVEETTEADAILERAIVDSQSVGYASQPVKLFRPPYAPFTTLGTANIAEFNQAHAGRTYLGPIFWDIGGELTEQYAADWACWSRVSIDQCADGYVREARIKKRGLVLAHDVHAKTVDMLMGTNGANGRSLIDELRHAGFKFVRLREHEEALGELEIRRAALAANRPAAIEASIKADPGGRVIVDVRTQSNAEIHASFDGEPPVKSFRGDSLVESILAPGQHFVTLRGQAADGALLHDDRFTFIVPALIDRAGQEATNEQNAVCVKFDLVKLGSQFQLFHGKTACDAPGAQRLSGSDECYLSKANVAAVRDPELVGAGEWLTELSMTYAADPTNKSKVAFQIDARTGEVEHGRRFEWTVGAERRDDATFDVTSVDCTAGVWRGKLKYADGATEDFFYRRAQ
jgi:peptidoglycan/xylan/chitin deacetylase (PgdA/CDA1 family)